jgi:hypothetical protein
MIERFPVPFLLTMRPFQNIDIPNQILKSNNQSLEVGHEIIFLPHKRYYNMRIKE